MTYRRAVATRNAVANAEGDMLDSGTIQFRTGAQPATPDTAAAGTLCGTVGFAATAFGAPSTGVVTAAAISSDTNADASGTVEHARLLTSGAAIHSDASCGLGSGDFNFDNNVIVAGGTIAVSALTLTAPQ